MTLGHSPEALPPHAEGPLSIYTDTIVAIATAPGIGGIGIVRLSGPQALSYFKILCPALSSITPRFAHYVSLIHPETNAALDDGVGLYFKGPNSFTGEDVVELQVHGSPVVLKEIVSVCLSLGARLADKGEFTKRAFIHGKLDLSQAESVIDIIHATSDMSKQVALDHLKGHLYQRISKYRTQLMTFLEEMEGSIDFPDEVPSVDRDALSHTLHEIVSAIDYMISIGDYGKWIHQGIKVVIVGQPNVGKSSLLNALAGENRAIVTDIAGTTRDFIDVIVELDGLSYQFIDTAGIRDQGDYIEQLGMEKITALIQEAHCVIWVVDGSQPFSEDPTKDSAILAKIKHKDHGIILKNKSDLGPLVWTLPDALYPKEWPSLALSTTTQAGLSDLKAYLIQSFSSKVHDVDKDLICNIRQLNCLKSALTHLTALNTTLIDGFEDDMLTHDLKQGILKLGELTGEEVTEEVLDGVFSRFCVGK